MEARLKLLSGLSSGMIIRIPNGKLVVGRGEDCDLQLLSAFVSTHHCILLFDDRTLRIRDLGSKNGTFVNGHQIGTSLTILLTGDTVSIGELSVLVDLAPEKPGTEPPDSEARSAVSSPALQESAFVAGETIKVDNPVAIPLQPSTPSPISTPVVPNDLLLSSG